jgi:integrase/recombinase XerD
MSCLFESSWKKHYSSRGVRAMLARYAANAGLPHNMPPYLLRHSLFTWLKTRHTTRTSLEIYSKVAIGHAQNTYATSSTPSPCKPPNQPTTAP